MSRGLSTFLGDQDEAGADPSPFLSRVRDEIPMELRTALDYCKFLYISTPVYRSVSRRIVGHFVTQLDFRGEIGSPEEQTKFEEFFREEINGLNEIRLLGEDFSCYGNGFFRVHLPFTRMLVDRRGAFRQYTPSMFPEELVSFDLASLTYEVPDPTDESRSLDTRRRVKLPIRDIPSKDYSRIRIRRLDPRYCRLRYSEISGATQVEYDFSPEFRGKVRRGVLYEVNETPIDILRTVRNNETFLFDRDEVFHLKNDTIMGISNDGWGLPEILAHFPVIHKIAVYDRIDEAVGSDYMAPFRIIAPDLKGAGDNRSHLVADEWVPAVQAMIAQQRADRRRIHGFPYPFVYQELGGNGKQLAPKDVKEYEIRHLMNCVGYPLELMEGSLQLQQMPAALRMFESSHPHLSSGLAAAARFATRKISQYMNGEAFNTTLRSSTTADDLERRSLIFNLFSSDEISRRRAFEGLFPGVDHTSLKVERAKEDAEIQRKLNDVQAEEERKQQLGSINNLLSEGGTGGANQPGASTTPLDLRAQAEQLAQQWLQIPQDGQRSIAMQQVRSTSPDLYAVAKDIMEQIRRSGASQGRQAVVQQLQQGAPTQA